MISLAGNDTLARPQLKATEIQVRNKKKVQIHKEDKV